MDGPDSPNSPNNIKFIFRLPAMEKNGSNRPHKVLVILSSVREGRQGAKVAQAVIKHLGSYGNLNAEILGKENIKNTKLRYCEKTTKFEKISNFL